MSIVPSVLLLHCYCYLYIYTYPQYCIFIHLITPKRCVFIIKKLISTNLLTLCLPLLNALQRLIIEFDLPDLKISRLNNCTTGLFFKYRCNLYHYKCVNDGYCIALTIFMLLFILVICSSILMDTFYTK